MLNDITKAASNILLGADWHDSIEACVRTQIRGFIQLMLEAELSSVLGRARPSTCRTRANQGRRKRMQRWQIG
jgi:hypothetical protein